MSIPCTTQLANNVVVMVGQSVDGLQSDLEHIGAGLLGNKVPVGIVTSPKPPKHTYVHNQVFSSNPAQTIQNQEDQELLDQLNIALQVMAAGGYRIL